LPKKEEKINRSFRNIAGMRILETRNLNILDLLKYKFLIVSKPKESLNEF